MPSWAKCILKRHQIWVISKSVTVESPVIFMVRQACDELSRALTMNGKNLSTVHPESWPELCRRFVEGSFYPLRFMTYYAEAVQRIPECIYIHRLLISGLL